MDNLIEIVKKEDIYNIVVPICIPFLGWIFSLFANRMNYEKQWKLAAEKSKRDEYIKYFVCTIGMGLFSIFSCCLILFSIEIMLSIEFSAKIAKILCALTCATLYIYFIFESRDNKIVESEVYNFILLKTPPFISALMFLFLFIEKWEFVSQLLSFALVIAEMVFWVTLDGTRNNKYTHVNFHFYNGKTIEKIKLTGIKQKGGWIIVQDTLKCRECRFRAKEIEMVEYKNEVNQCVP